MCLKLSDPVKGWGPIVDGIHILSGKSERRDGNTRSGSLLTVVRVQRTRDDRRAVNWEFDIVCEDDPSQGRAVNGNSKLIAYSVEDGREEKWFNTWLSFTCQ